MMKLRTRFLLLMSLIFLCFMLLTWYLSLRWMNQVNFAWGQQFSERQVIFDKYRILLPLLPEIALARKMASDPAIINMALHENNTVIREAGLTTLENYRLHFKSHDYFAAMANSGDYYFNNRENQYKGKQLRYVLSPNNSHDRWFYATIKDNKIFQININPDVHLNVTKVWINVLIRHDKKVLGIVGTGINLKHFLKESVSVSKHGIHNLIIDKSMSIQLDTDPTLIDYMSVAKRPDQHIKVAILLKKEKDITRLQQAMDYLKIHPHDIRTFWVDYAGTRHLLGVAYLPEIGWYDLTFMDVKNVLLIEHNLFMPLSLGALFLVALIIMGLALRQWIIRPIVTLQASSDSIREGNLDFEPPLVGQGEIRQLAESFSSMAKHIRDTNHELENKVIERTAELTHLTEIDPLTGLLNRRGMTDRLEKEIP
ncbi:MAG: HAMP domain-containing protein, partial [Pseudomonadota bacterium]|nr:HAMP domain-containing protein [Pseudomonadota bacterium]